MATFAIIIAVDQIDDRIANPATKADTRTAGDFGQLERVLEQGFLRVAESFQSGAMVSRAMAAPNFEQGVDMDCSELGDLEQVLG